MLHVKRRVTLVLWPFIHFITTPVIILDIPIFRKSRVTQIGKTGDTLVVSGWQKLLKTVHICGCLAH